MPRRASSAAIAAEPSGWIVLASMTTVPAAAASSAPRAPRSASRTISAVMRQVMMTKAPCAASAGEVASAPPRSAWARIGAAATSYPRTGKPAAIRFSARAEPRRPMPMSAITSAMG